MKSQSGAELLPWRKIQEGIAVTSSMFDKQFKGELIAYDVAELDEKQAKITLSYPSGGT